MKSKHFDVIVVGGGPAGIVAAVQAARAGAATLLVEKSGILGGTTVLSGVNFPGHFYAWGQQVIAGIGWELVQAAKKEMNQAMPDFSDFKNLRNHQLQVLVDKAAYACLADEMVMKSGATLLLHTMVGQVQRLAEGTLHVPATAESTAKPSAKHWEVMLCGKEGMRAVTCNVLVDCTGDANVVRMAGYPLRRNEMRQPGTLVMEIGGFSRDNVKWDTLEEAFSREVREGRMLKSDFNSYGGPNPAKSFLYSGGGNSIHVVGIDAETSEGKTDAELKARAAMLRIIRFFRSQPGLENFCIKSFATECGIRETATIVGELSISVEDYASGRIWGDSVCNSFYPIDLHMPAGNGLDFRPLQEGTVPTIPLRALLPKGSRHLIVAGRIASGDQLANSAYRVQGSAMAMGQAAGAVAALAAAQGRELREIPIQCIHALLEAHGAIVPKTEQATVAV